MVNKSIGMTQLRRIIQLRAEGLSKLKISDSVRLHRTTLDNYLSKVEATGKSYTELLGCSDEQLGAMIYSSQPLVKADKRLEDLNKHMDYFKQELLRTGVTRKLLSDEYRSE